MQCVARFPPFAVADMKPKGDCPCLPVRTLKIHLLFANPPPLPKKLEGHRKVNWVADKVQALERSCEPLSKLLVPT